MASREEDKAMAGLLRKSLAGPDARTGNDCPEPELLAAYFDHSLDADDTKRYDLHFSQCSRCREQLAAMARASGGDAVEKKTTGGWNWLRTPRWLMPAAGAFAMLVLFAGITLHKWKAEDAANEVAMSQPQASPQTVPESSAPSNAAPSESSPPPTTPSRATITADQLASGASPRSKAAEERYLRALPLNEQKKWREAAKAASPTPNTPARVATDSSASAQNAMGEVPPTTNAETVELQPSKPEIGSATGDSAGIALEPASEGGAKQPGANQGKASARAGAPGSLSPKTTNFAARSARDAAERARIQQAQMYSNLMAGFMVPTPDANVMWMVSDTGSIGRSEDAGATWKSEPLETRDHFVAGSAPTAKICWLVADHGTILRTTDGKTWTTVEPPVVANFEGLAGIEAKDE